MSNKWLGIWYGSTILFCFVLFNLWPSYSPAKRSQSNSVLDANKTQEFPKWVKVKSDVSIGNYFQFIDSLVIKYDSLSNYTLTEHLLVRANPWIIDTLANTDYYRMMERDSFVYDQRKMVVLRVNDSLTIPDSLYAAKLSDAFEKILIDVNIPEYKLWIYQDSSLLFTFPIRVGRNESKYLTMGDRVTDLRTTCGEGTIVRHDRDPAFYNPVDGKKFHLTERDDQKTTLMPQIPWIETEIDGVRNGQMIHPTTNPETLGKAYSNGCIGTAEADAWVIYYYAPIDTHIRIRYDLQLKDEEGNDSLLKDVYNYH